MDAELQEVGMQKGGLFWNTWVLRLLAMYLTTTLVELHVVLTLLIRSCTGFADEVPFCPFPRAWLERLSINIWAVAARFGPMGFHGCPKDPWDPAARHLLPADVGEALVAESLNFCSLLHCVGVVSKVLMTSLGIFQEHLSRSSAKPHKTKICPFLHSRELPAQGLSCLFCFTAGHQPLPQLFCSIHNFVSPNLFTELVTDGGIAKQEVVQAQNSHRKLSLIKNLVSRHKDHR